MLNLCIWLPAHMIGHTMWVQVMRVVNPFCSPARSSFRQRVTLFDAMYSWERDRTLESMQGMADTDFERVDPKNLEADQFYKILYQGAKSTGPSWHYIFLRRVQQNKKGVWHYFAHDSGRGPANFTIDRVHEALRPKRDVGALATSTALWSNQPAAPMWEQGGEMFEGDWSQQDWQDEDHPPPSGAPSQDWSQDSHPQEDQPMEEQPTGDQPQGEQPTEGPTSCVLIPVPMTFDQATYQATLEANFAPLDLPTDRVDATLDDTDDGGDDNTIPNSGEEEEEPLEHDVCVTPSPRTPSEEAPTSPAPRDATPMPPAPPMILVPSATTPAPVPPTPAYAAPMTPAPNTHDPQGDGSTHTEEPQQEQEQPTSTAAPVEVLTGAGSSTDVVPEAKRRRTEVVLHSEKGIQIVTAPLTETKDRAASHRRRRGS